MNKNNITSDNQLDVARALSDYQIESIRGNESLGGAVIADRLQQLRDVVWTLTVPDGEDERRDMYKKREETFNAALKDLNETQTAQLLESYTRMGYLYEVGGLTARDNYFNKLEGDGKAIPGGVEEFVANETDAKSAVAKLNTPVFETCMTMHPTNVKALAPMRALRKIATTIREGTDADVQQAVADYQATPVLHQQDGRPANLTVRDETDTMLYFLNNIYTDLPGVYRHYDEPLQKKFGGDYNPADINIQARFDSWGSAGDKDGNNSVTWEKTLEAIGLHTKEIVMRYADDMKDINASELDGWKQKLAAAQQALGDENAGLLHDLVQLRKDSDAYRGAGGKGAGSPEEFSRRGDELSEKLAAVREQLDAVQFAKDVEAAYKASGDEKTRDLMRRARMFKFNFAKIEYRETSEEYSKVVSELIPGYADLDPHARAAKLTELLQGDLSKGEIHDRAQAILDRGAAIKLGTEDVQPIAFHTLKRMELARDHGSIIHDNVLAECGQMKDPNATKEDTAAQGLANILEAQLLQRVVEKNGRRPNMGIVPLFEEPATLENIVPIMEAAYTNVVYKQHLQDVANLRHDGTITQQVQLAHSDNRRRTGSPGATANIHDAHKQMRRLNEKHGVRGQFFQGGSLSDPFRNGVRAISAMVNAFGMHDFAKFTFQGGDNFNYFNHPGSNERMFTRHFAHPASRVYQDGDEWKVGRKDEQGPPPPGRPDRRPNEVIDDTVIKALRKTQYDYQQDDFTRETMGVLMAVIGVGYTREAAAYNRGSRAPDRGLAFGSATSTQLGAAVQAVADKIVPIELDKLRTIPFSKVPQQNQLTPSWIGAQKMEQHLREEIIATRDKDTTTGTSAERDFFREKFADVKADTPLSPEQMNMLYDKSPTFRDAMDKIAFSIARSDMDAVKANVGPKLAPRNGEDPSRELRDKGDKYFTSLEKTYDSVGELAYQSLMGKSRITQHNQPRKYLRHDTEHGRVQADAITALNGLAPEIALKSGYQEFLVHAKHDLQGRNQLNDVALATIGGGVDAVVHSRWLSADDEVTAKFRRKESQTTHVGASGLTF